MATLGDPLMDLGTTLAYWVQPHDPADQLKRAFGPTMVEGSLTRRELIDRYADRTQRHLPDMTFYFAYGLFKLAVIIQQIYIRYLRGNTQDPRFAELGTTVESLAWRGCDVIENGVG
jgi:aminoglycoside phosphotransferase (APT) family kinase protein